MWRRCLPYNARRTTAYSSGAPDLLQVSFVAMATSTVLRALRVSAPAQQTRTAQRAAAPRRAVPPARAGGKARGEGAPTEVAQRTGKSELVFDSAPAVGKGAAASLARQLYSEACESAVNTQINVEVRLRGRSAGRAAQPRRCAHAPGRSHPRIACLWLP